MTSPTDPTNPYQQGTPGAQGPEPTFNQVPPEGASPYQQQAPGYEQPATGYQQPAPGYGQPTPAYASGPVTDDALSTVKLNLWLSVFFSWIPALIFFLTQKDVPANVKDIHRENLNFQILRTIAGLVVWIPIVGWALFIVLLVFAIIAAVQAPDVVAQGGTYKYKFNIQFIK
ncbi:DUF4870 domain-containing protein [Rarobacter faecitabidus]|uniref:Putative Tic20 family protein n=1 Tax=Rarobacter faecitabidus TaxID=13243 RepID=A0A542ZP20_RARFA|nr:DUF4870 domain-containing protein [Rarobacter faecitabidus]TQL62102.1 putative Tic20 family protein [Rarobacter faecitabidus]